MTPLHPCVDCGGPVNVRMVCTKCHMAHIRPQAGPQSDFVHSDAYMTLAGGARGGGKTYGLLMRPIFKRRMDGEWSGPLGAFDDPDFTGVIFRKERERLRGAGRLWEIAKKFYEKLGGVKNENLLTITFPSGASIRFMGLRNADAVEKHRGAAYTWIGFEEATEFEYSQVLALMRTNRNSGNCQIEPWIDMTCNPTRDTWLLDFVEPYVYPEGHELAGLPKPEESGRMRHFFVRDSKTYWVEDEHPEMRPDAWVDDEGNAAKTFTFIPSRVEDNPALLSISKDYISTLMAQTYVEQQRDRYGNWYAVEAGGLFARASIHWTHALPPPTDKLVWYWDLAATERANPTHRNASAGVLACLHECPACLGFRFVGADEPCAQCNVDSLGVPFVDTPPDAPEKIFWVVQTSEVELGPAELREHIRALALNTGIDVPVYLEEEFFSAGKITTSTFRDLVLPEFQVFGDTPKGTKITRANNLVALGERGLWRVTIDENRLLYARAVREFPAEYGRDLIDASTGALKALHEHSWTTDLWLF